MQIHRNYRWTLIPDISFSESWNMDKWMTGGSSIATMALIKSWKSVNRCALLTLFAFRLLLPYRTQNKKITDVITSDSLSRHPGTPKSLDESPPTK